MRIQIQLRDFCPWQFARVRDRHGDIAAAHGEVAVAEGRVGQPVAEGEGGGDAVLVVVTVADEEALSVVGVQWRRRNGEPRVLRGAEVLLGPLFKLVCRFEWAQSDIRTCSFSLFGKVTGRRACPHTRTFQACMGK